MIRKRYILIFIMFSLFSNIVIAEERPPNVLLNLKDVNTNEDVSSVIVSIDFGYDVLTQFVDEGEIVRINLDDGFYDIEFKIDSQLTEGKDYYGKDSLILENNIIKSISLYPVGSIRGIVKDNLDNIVPNAKIKFECSGADIVDLPTTADEFGSFSVTYIPVGNCRILATYQEGVGYTNLIIEQGSLNEIEIVLDKSIAPKKQNILWIVILILFVAIFIVIYVFGKQIRDLTKQDKKYEKKEEKESRPEKRSKDILATLNNKEKDVVNHLMNNKNKSTQASIRHNTGIPRTSLARVLKSLEDKNIIKIKREGNTVKVVLTDWFLGNE